MSWAQQLALNALCRARGIPYIAVGTHGLHAYLFNDFALPGFLPLAESLAVPWSSLGRRTPKLVYALTGMTQDGSTPAFVALTWFCLRSSITAV